MMTGRYVVTEVGQTFCAIFQEDEIVLAGLVHEPLPEDLQEISEQILVDQSYSDGPRAIGAWLAREYDEGRAAVIEAHFEVSA